MKTLLILLALLLPSLAHAQSDAEKSAMRAALQSEFNKYTRPHDASTSARILNDAAASRPGWVLLGKKGGNRCPLSDGRDISCDFVVWKATVRGFDVIGSVGAPDSNISGPSGTGEDMAPSLANGSRTLEEPVGNEPPPVDPPEPPFDPTALIQRIDELQARIAALSGALAVAFEETSALHVRAGALEQALERVDAKAEHVLGFLKSRPIPDGCRVPLLGCRLTFNAPPIE
jgi:hypothetical protein